MTQRLIDGDWPMPVPPPEAWEEERQAKPPGRRRSSEKTCEARFRDGMHCPHAAKHARHVKPAAIDDLPIVVHVCGIHARTLDRREFGSEHELLDHWLR